MNKEERRIMSLPGMQEKFREAMGAIKPYDQFWCPRYRRDTNEFLCKEWDCRNGYIDHCDGIESTTIRLPLPIDRDNPERGLWGMVDWSHWDIATNHLGEVSLFNTTTRSTIHYTTPTLALLRALASQWGIEI
jgi:hypothetical protein